MQVNQLKPSREYELDTEDEGVVLQLVEDPSGACHLGTGATVWDAGIVLAKYLEKRCQIAITSTSNRYSQRPFPCPVRAVELGAGTGIVSLVLAHCLEARQQRLLSSIDGIDEVIVTDKSNLIPLIRHNASLNSSTLKQCQLTVQALDWTEDSSLAIASPIDIILLSDTLFDATLYDPLLKTLNQLAGPQTEIILAYERREFDQEVHFFAKFGELFTFHDIKPHELHENWQSEDIYVFSAKRR
ncbi:putative methyltransferase-domain-containing protein [Syncephalis fuscata]|nr:putative methyltransferase-domain-containing protein [Syncephalis fuscata]